MSDPAFEGSYVAVTGAGMCGLWQAEHFEHVTSLNAWEDEVSEDEALASHVRKGAFVPLNVGGDGCFRVTIREGGRNAREKRYTLVSSDPYLLVSRGTLMLGGLENVGSYIGGAQQIAFPAGRHLVKVHLLDWKAEPGSVGADGSPTGIALPDFLVEIHPEPDGFVAFRSTVRTFERS
ncbi:hypothetical protein AB0873_29915 [Micromonospora sp. NPDC047707]|uniref:hypothetical protein n=1 Tax=Micromonospora sp. NPDC047707 TaxID=3154498 RepID=UPI0034520120